MMVSGVRSRTQGMVLCALFAAMTAVLSQVAIPLPLVPINMALLAVYLSGGVLGARLGTLSQVVYVCLGAVGLPVFSLFRGGIGILLGPTGGYIAGYIVAAVVVGFWVEHHGTGFWQLVLGMVIGLALCYALGTAWFMGMTGTGLGPSLAFCVWPFVVPDICKGACALAVGTAVAKRLSRGAAR